MSDNNEHFTELVTEQMLAASANLDQCSMIEILQLINAEDHRVAPAISKQLEAIAKVAESMFVTIENGGRVFYLGAGTSGRLGILDAAECRPTFSLPDGVIVGLIAGGKPALTSAIEGAEDQPTLAVDDLQAMQFNAQDMLIGIAASGRTPYVLGGIKYANEMGAKTAALSCATQGLINQAAQQSIAISVGAEVISGSTRMKAGTAQKLVLNMLSTSVMVKLGKVFGNLMVDVQASNQKLQARAINIVQQATDCDRHTAITTLHSCDYQCKVAILMILSGLDRSRAEATLAANHHLRDVLAQQ